MTWAVHGAVNLRYMFFHHAGASGQRASNEEDSHPAAPPVSSF